jgi:5-(carboxyamino)imidazole ribonucleotide synthase
MATFAADCAVVTYEFENVPVAPLRALGQVPLHRTRARWKWRRTG